MLEEDKMGTELAEELRKADLVDFEMLADISE